MLITDWVQLAKRASKEVVEAMAPQAWEGYIQQGSWNPQTGTVQVIVGNTAALDTPILLTMPLLTNGIGVQVGPVGYERVIVIHAEGGYYAIPLHGADDSPNAPSGELWLQPNQLSSGIKPAAVKSFLRMQNDGATRIGGTAKTTVVAPIFEVTENANQNADNGLVRLSDLKAALADLAQKTQDALNSLASECQAGQGVAPPTIASPTAKASSVSFSG